jgi:hypothetical protein
MSPDTNTPDSASSRCSSPSSCSTGQVCLVPDEREQLLRLTVMLPEWIQHHVRVDGDQGFVADAEAVPHVPYKATVVLWDGPREEVYEQSWYLPCG